MQCCGETLKEPDHTRGHLKNQYRKHANESIIIIGIVIIAAIIFEQIVTTINKKAVEA